MFSEETTKEEENKDELPSCSSFLGHWRQCTSATNHLHHYYIYGEYADCSNIKALLRNCFYYKMKKTDEYKEKFLENIKVLEDKQNFVVKPTASVWEIRENPAADWLKKGV